MCMEDRIKRIVSALVVLLVMGAVLLVSRERRETQTAHTKDLFAMDTFFSLKVYGFGGEDALEQCAERIRELEGLLSVTGEGSDVWRINHPDSGYRIAVSADVCLLIESALEIGDETYGALDITLYPVLREWGFTTGEYRIPQAESIQALLEKVDYKKIKPDTEEMTVLAPEGMEIDLGAVAKGYTGDCLVELLRNRGVTSAILDLGGNIQTLGAKPDGVPWRVAVKDPFEPDRELGVLEVTDKAVITSGGYERYFTGEDGRDYWHILDPADGYPADSGLVSVTVVGDSGVRCDGLSTALFVMGKEKAVELYRQAGDFEMLLVTEDGGLYITEGLEDCFECGGGWCAEIIPAGNQPGIRSKMKGV